MKSNRYKGSLLSVFFTGAAKIQSNLMQLLPLSTLTKSVLSLLIQFFPSLYLFAESSLIGHNWAVSVVLASSCCCFDKFCLWLECASPKRQLSRSMVSKSVS